MSPNGTLLAYSTPVDIKDLRDQAALISMAWKEHETALQAKSNKAQGPESTQPSDSPVLETLTIEFQHNNIIVRAIQPKLLLVLVGGVPPGRKPSFKITPEAYGDPRYPSAALDQESITDAPRSEEERSSAQESPSSGDGTNSPKQKAPSIAESHMSQREKDMKLGTLHIQRKKLDAMTGFVRADFDSRGFVMPDDSSFP